LRVPYPGLRLPLPTLTHTTVPGCLPPYQFYATCRLRYLIPRSGRGYTPHLSHLTVDTLPCAAAYGRLLSACCVRLPVSLRLPLLTRLTCGSVRRAGYDTFYATTAAVLVPYPTVTHYAAHNSRTLGLLAFSSGSVRIIRVFLLAAVTHWFALQRLRLLRLCHAPTAATSAFTVRSGYTVYLYGYALFTLYGCAAAHTYTPRHTHTHGSACVALAFYTRFICTRTPFYTTRTPHCCAFAVAARTARCAADYATV